jgi:hypothetical protein
VERVLVLAEHGARLGQLVREQKVEAARRLGHLCQRLFLRGHRVVFVVVAGDGEECGDVGPKIPRS